MYYKKTTWSSVYSYDKEQITNSLLVIVQFSFCSIWTHSPWLALIHTLLALILACIPHLSYCISSITSGRRGVAAGLAFTQTSVESHCVPCRPPVVSQQWTPVCCIVDKRLRRPLLNLQSSQPAWCTPRPPRECSCTTAYINHSQRPPPPQTAGAWSFSLDGTWWQSGKRTCDCEVECSNPVHGCCVPTPTQHAIPMGSVSE